MMLAQVLLKAGIGRNVRLVVAEEIELDLIAAGAVEEMLVERVALRGNPCCVCFAVLVLELGGTGLQKGAQIVSIFLCRRLPVGLDRVPTLAEAHLVRVTVLRDQRGDTLGVSDGEAEADGGTVVKDVEGVSTEAERLGKSLDDFGEMIKGVGEGFRVGSVREAEARQVRSDDAVLVR